jgi:CheY-like chemotaxis protein
MSALDLISLKPEDTAVVLRARDTIARQVNELDRLIDSLALERSAGSVGGADMFAACASNRDFDSGGVRCANGGINDFPVQSHDSPANPETALCGRQILIVDDNVDAAESLGEFLKASGHHIHVAHDGPTALAEAARLRPEVVILDIGMPAMNGYQVAQRLRSDLGLTSSLLVAITGYTQDRDRLDAHAAGFDFHFSKPIDISRLAALLQ